MFIGRSYSPVDFIKIFICFELFVNIQTFSALYTGADNLKLFSQIDRI